MQTVFSSALEIPHENRKLQPASFKYIQESQFSI